jgi:pimeloyl-ACP methyl ester carboxylesterase
MTCATTTLELGHERSLGLTYAGTGPDLVLLHGALATRRDWLEGPFEDLARHGRAIAVDRPGHGESRRPRLEASPRAQAAQIHEGLQAFGSRRPLLVAHSLGGLVALAYAEQFPDSLSGMVLVAPIALPEVRPLEHSIYGPRAVPLFGPAFAGMMGSTIDRPLLELLHGLMFAPDWPPARWKRNYPWGWILSAAGGVANGEDFAVIHPLSAQPRVDLERIAAPVHIVYGTGDLIVRGEVQSEPLARRLSGSRISPIKGAGHMLHHSRRDVLVEAVQEALALSAA